MTVLDQDLSLVCGNDYRLNVQLYEGASGSVPLDLTPAVVVEWVVKRELHPDYPALISKSLGSGITINPPSTNGSILLEISDEDTLPLAGERLVGHFVHEMVVADVLGHQSSVFQGILTIRGTNQ